MRAETTVWVADPDTVDVGYHHGGVGIILDQATPSSAGTKAPVMMLTAPVRDSVRAVHRVEGGGSAIDYRVVHHDRDGEADRDRRSTDKHVREMFFCEAAMVQQTGSCSWTRKQVDRSSGGAPSRCRSHRGCARTYRASSRRAR